MGWSYFMTPVFQLGKKGAQQLNKLMIYPQLCFWLRNLCWKLSRGSRCYNSRIGFKIWFGEPKRAQLEIWITSRWAPGPVVNGVILTLINGLMNEYLGSITLLIGVIAPFITDRGPPCSLFSRLLGLGELEWHGPNRHSCFKCGDLARETLVRRMTF